ncbi:MAG: carboxypeptidase regulatory-like domain-containing protein [Planctomycetota bacterium]
MTGLLLLLCLTGTIRVQVEGEATRVVAFRRGLPVAQAPVVDGVASLSCDEADLVAFGPRRRSELVRRVRPSTGEGFDATLVTRPCHVLKVNTESGAAVYVGGARFTGEVYLLPGMHRIVVDHPRFVSSASRLVRIDGDREITVDLEPGLVVAGTVHGKDGKPLAGAGIAVYADGYAARRSAISDAAGRFAISGFRGNVISLRVRADGHATRLVRVPFEPGSERARVDPHLVAGVSVKLPAAPDARATLLPRWLDRALEEPRLAANDEPIRASGKIEFEGLMPGRTYRILLERPGYRPAASEPFQAGPDVKLPAVAQEPATRLWGRLDRPGLFVVCRGAFGERVSRTDRGGRFEFDGLERGKAVLFVRDVDERGQTVELQKSGLQEVKLAYEKPPSDRVLSGTVLDAERKPLGGVIVTAAGRRARTNEQGEFEVGPMPLGRTIFDLRLEPAPGSRGFLKDPHLPRVEERARVGIKVRAQLERSGTLDLRFPGTRLARATLILEGTTGLRQQWRIPRGAQSMRIEEIPVGDYVVEVGAPGYLGTGGAVQRAVAKEVEPVEIRLLRGRTVSGRVAKRRGIPREGKAPHLVDTPVRNGVVTLFDGAARFALATAPVGDDGSFVLEGLPEAPVLLCAAIPGHPVGILRVDLKTGDARNVLIPIFSPLPAGVKLRMAAAGELPSVRMAVMNEYGLDVRDIAARARFQGVVADDLEFDDITLLFRLERKPAGVIEHRGLAPGNYEFRVTASGYKQGVGKVRVRTSWTLDHIGSLLPEFSNPLVPIWLHPTSEKPEKPGAD